MNDKVETLMGDWLGHDPREPETMTLTDFLLARIAEDEGVARKFDQELVRDFGAPAATLLSSELTLAGSGYMDYPVLTIDSTRVLAECEAKRRIVEGAFAYTAVVAPDRRDALSVFLESTLRALALPYADHPDYREEWKP